MLSDPSEKLAGSHFQPAQFTKDYVRVVYLDLHKKRYFMGISVNSSAPRRVLKSIILAIAAVHHQHRCNFNCPKTERSQHCAFDVQSPSQCAGEDEVDAVAGLGNANFQQSC
jgi:hypothetical protein